MDSHNDKMQESYKKMTQPQNVNFIANPLIKLIKVTSHYDVKLVAR